MAQGQWKELRKQKAIEETPHLEPGTVKLEIWGYPPQLFVENGVVDPLSLFLSLRGNPDERIEAALDEMMETVKW